MLLDRSEMAVTFDGVGEAPLLSINRDFSSPAVIEVARAPGELERLAEVDGDPFARFEALQELMMRALLAGARGEAIDAAPVIAAMGSTLASNALDPAYKAEALIMPSESGIGDRMDQVDPAAIHAARNALRKAIGGALAEELVGGAWPDRAGGRSVARPPRACGGCAGWRWGCSRRPTRRARRGSPRRNMTPPTI